ncbi:MAG: hypothetical protein JW725_04720 [Candidatus Babeliaceae bacterium]|nr:hypothetical protein [Candidatus Babeliaceae bacterium]
MLNEKINNLAFFKPFLVVLRASCRGGYSDGILGFMNKKIIGEDQI